MPFRLVPAETKLDFLRLRFAAFVLSAILIVASGLVFSIRGLNFGIDFAGGILIEAGTENPPDVGLFRSTVSGLGLGDASIQEFGASAVDLTLEDVAGQDAPSNYSVLIRIEAQEGGEDVGQAAVLTVQNALTEAVGEEISWRRIEFVGPKVSGELIQDGILSVVLAVIAVLIYIWFRFEWQFGVGAVVALVHDVLLTVGLFSSTGLEFNLTSIAAILTIVGYSLNDTVVVYDRIRENLRKYRSMALIDVLNMSLNSTLSRTLMTSVTTLLALLALFFFGGPVIRGFTAAMIWGVFIGTYSSVFIAAPVLLFLKVNRPTIEDAAKATP
ncbi:MAG: protein translocase subunit SecF [Sphingomonadales bacterium]|nr:protein translocase subunit SecF [Sphingomonadales bacterium]